MLSAGQIQRGVDWLMYHGSAGVKFRTARDLLGWKGKRLEALHVELTNSPQAQVVFAKQKPDGSWFCGGPWSSAPQYEPKSGYSAFAPKYVTAVWILSILGDMGLDLCDEPVRRGCDYVMGHQMPSGRFGRFRAPQARTEEAATAANMPCELGIYLMALGKVGMGQDPRLDKSYDLLAGWQREDGGWVNDCHKEKFGWTRSCPWSTHHGMMALSYSRRPAYTESVRRGLEFQVWHLGTKAPAPVAAVLLSRPRHDPRVGDALRAAGRSENRAGAVAAGLARRDVPSGRGRLSLSGQADFEVQLENRRRIANGSAVSHISGH